MLIQECIKVEVDQATNVQQIMHSDVLNAIFEELCRHGQSQEFITYLYKDLLENKFELEEISGRVLEDKQQYLEKRAIFDNQRDTLDKAPQKYKPDEDEVKIMTTDGSTY